MPRISPADGPVAVTGVTGFTGGHMVRELVIHGYQVRACLRDASSDRGRDGIAYLQSLPGVKIVDKCDLFTPGSYDDAFKGCSCVFAVAAVLGNSATNQPIGSGNVAKDIYAGGIAGMANIVESVNRSGSVKRLIYTSSMAAVHSPKNISDEYEWTEIDWASDGVDPQRWNHPANAYTKSKVDTERMLNEAAAKSDGRWDVVTMNPAMICGPILFRSQSGQWIEQIGRLAGGLPPRWPSPFDMYYDIIDVRDLVAAHRLAAESSVDHKATVGGPRYLMHGTGGRSSIRFGTELKEIVAKCVPSLALGTPSTTTRSGRAISVVRGKGVNDSKKAKTILGVTLRPVEETIRDTVESSLTLGLVKATLRSRL